MTKVIFRMLRGEVIALFPEIPGSYDPNTCLSYMHFGQHASATMPVGRRLATRAEYADLKAELKSIGYKLKVIKRATPSMRRLRIAELEVAS